MRTDAQRRDGRRVRGMLNLGDLGNLSKTKVRTLYVRHPTLESKRARYERCYSTPLI